jgi:hypothetical protein
MCRATASVPETVLRHDIPTLAMPSAGIEAGIHGGACVFVVDKVEKPSAN